MRHIKTFSLFESVQILTPEQKNFLDKYTKGGPWSLNPSTGLVDVDGDFDCSREGLNDLLGIRFGKAFWNFYCNGNNLTSLEGAPQTVGGDFSCYNNNIKTLEGAPQTVGGGFYCENNDLTSLEGAPQTVGGEFYCFNNKITSLAGAPKTIRGKFSSDGLSMQKGEWSMDTLIKIFLDGTPNQQQLVAPLVDPKVIQQQIDENPEGMLAKLKGVLKHPNLHGLKWPSHLEQEKGLLSDLGDVGL
jgi:hypothetical protein